MTEAGLIYVAAIILSFAMVARRIERWPLTAPMFFIGAGYVLSTTSWADPKAAEEALHLVAETTLIILLFLDASQIDLKQLKEQHVWPKRMLLIGLPLAVAIGTAANMLIVPEWPLIAAALVAALLAPTDAALGQSVVTNKVVPVRVRRGLTIESGLNDGLALPIILMLASLLGELSSQGAKDWVLFGAEQVILGPIIGAAVGFAGGWVVLLANRRGWTGETYEGIGALALAVLSYLAATQLGGNGFIAAFVAGLCFGNLLQGRCRFLFEFTESEGQLFMWTAFFLVGFGLLPEALAYLSLSTIVIILVSLFLVRPTAIWLSLVGTDAAHTTRLFFGWFGPRGLATALFALLILPQIGGEWSEIILSTAVNAVWISAVLHGVSAVALGDLYGRHAAKMGDCAEMMPMGAPFEKNAAHANKSTKGGKE